MTWLLLLSALLVQDKPFPDADPTEAIAAAKKKAAAENRQVLVVWGANDSEPSRAAASMLKKDKEIARLILYEYDLVLADVARADGALKRGMESEKLPWISLPAPDGMSVGYYNTPADSKSMIEFLKKHQREPRIAKDVLAAALKKAGGEKKRVLLAFGAPW